MGVSIKVGKNNPMAEYVPETMVEAASVKSAIDNIKFSLESVLCE